jgi:[protein-PII] uridylyltransferase
VDQWLTSFVADTNDVALVALGGYGRRELCPFSDLDLLILHRGRADVDVLAERIWYPVWDERLRLDHSVRTVKQAVRMAENDLRTALSLLDGRVVAGDPTLGDELNQGLRGSLTKLRRRWLQNLDDVTQQRHASRGDIAFLLEPDLKEAKGGLRDATVLRHIARFADFVTVDPATWAAHDELLATRVELHRIAGRASDVLILQEQDEIGRRLGREDGDELMAMVADDGRRLAWASDDAWRRIRAWVDGPTRVGGGGHPRDLGRGVVRRDREIVITPAGVDEGLSVVLHAAAHAARSNLPFDRDTLGRLSHRALPLPEPWADPSREGFLALVGAGDGLVAVFEALDHTGVWTALIPEWGAVRSRPQRNAFHRYTVDRHLIECAVQASRLTGDVERPDLLLVAALFHDIGKGYTGDHTDRGVELIGRIGARIGFAAADVDLLRTLVELHLLLPDVATRRDLDDPRTVTSVVAQVGTTSLLDLLAALTEADARATGPLAWTPWRASLVRDLVGRVRDRLTGRTSQRNDEQRGVEPPGSVDVVTITGGDVEATIVAPDRRGLFCAVAGVLALHGLDILGAAAMSTDVGTAVDTFHVQPTFGRAPRWDLVESDVRAVLRGEMSLDDRLADRQRTYGNRHARLGARQPDVSVQFHDDASDISTVVDVRGPASLGTLYRMTRVFAAFNLDIRHARVTTIGNQAVDSFYLVDANGEKLTDATLRHHLSDAITSALASSG